MELIDSLHKLTRRMDAYEAELAIKQQRAADKKAKADAKAKADEEATRERIQAALDDLHENTGDLHPLPPKQEQDESEGDLPRELTEKNTPPPSGNFAAEPPDLGGPPDRSRFRNPLQFHFGDHEHNIGT